MMDGDEVGATRESAFDHQLGERVDDRGQDVSASKHSLAQGHQISYGMVAIPNHLSIAVERRP